MWSAYIVLFLFMVWPVIYLVLIFTMGSTDFSFSGFKSFFIAPIPLLVLFVASIIHIIQEVEDRFHYLWVFLIEIILYVGCSFKY